MEAVLFIGAQASGKSTFYRERLFRSHVRINLDMLRTRHREARLVAACIEMKQRFVVDNTNPLPADRQRYITPAVEAGFRIIGYYFQSRLADCLARNAGRSADERIPDAGVRGTHARLVMPGLDEGFDALYYVRIVEPGAFEVTPWDAQATGTQPAR